MHFYSTSDHKNDFLFMNKQLLQQASSINCFWILVQINVTSVLSQPWTFSRALFWTAIIFDQGLHRAEESEGLWTVRYTKIRIGPWSSDGNAFDANLLTELFICKFNSIERIESDVISLKHSNIEHFDVIKQDHDTIGDGCFTSPKPHHASSFQTSCMMRF